jgi:phytoene dehydrogenase-like protein
MDKSIIIIGAGIAGLSAGCYGQMNGYKTRIFESHTLPGGLCTSWKRKGYTFDGCIHWLTGSGPGNAFYKIWEELGAIQGRQIVNHEESGRILASNGKTFIFYTNVDRLEQHLKEISPADSKLITELCSAIRTFSRFPMAVDKPRELLGTLDYCKMGVQMFPCLNAWRKYSQVSMHDLIMRFTDPFLREALLIAYGAAGFYSIPDFSVAIAAIQRSWYHAHVAGYPIGGSLRFAQAIEKRYFDMGGSISYKSPVKKILVRNNRAVGVLLEDGSEQMADIVISAADGHKTIFNLLDGKYINKEIRNCYDNLPVYQPCIQVSLGVARDLKDEPHSATYQLEQPINIGGEMRNWFLIKHFCYDPTLAPAGKSVIMTRFKSTYDYWKRMFEQRDRYEAEKQSILETVIAQLEKRFPGIENEVEITDVATPLTYERYTGNWQGSPQGWLSDIKTMDLGAKIAHSLPGLGEFYMVGQWVGEAGVPGAAMSGRNRIQLLCKQDHKKFVTTKP